MIKLILRDAKGQKRPLFIAQRNAEYNNLLIIKQIDNMTTFHALNGLRAGKKTQPKRFWCDFWGHYKEIRG